MHIWPQFRLFNANDADHDQDQHRIREDHFHLRNKEVEKRFALLRAIGSLPVRVPFLLVQVKQRIDLDDTTDPLCVGADGRDQRMGRQLLSQMIDVEFARLASNLIS